MIRRSPRSRMEGARGEAPSGAEAQGLLAPRVAPRNRTSDRRSPPARVDSVSSGVLVVRMKHPGHSQPGCLIPVARETTSTRAGAPRGASPRLLRSPGRASGASGAGGGAKGPRQPPGRQAVGGQTRRRPLAWPCRRRGHPHVPEGPRRRGSPPPAGPARPLERCSSHNGHPRRGCASRARRGGVPGDAPACRLVRPPHGRTAPPPHRPHHRTMPRRGRKVREG